ncbi:MAG: bifunctional riboflavin kinase/FAD synthetase [Parvularculaceae bacterium]
MSAAPVRSVAARGNFDGGHRGHQRLMDGAAALASRLRAAPGVVTFEPHPRRFFRPQDPPFLIDAPARRDALLRAAGAETILTLAFDADLARLSPAAFVCDVLRDRLRLAGVVAGADFRFGFERRGDAAALKALCVEAGLDAELVEPLADAAAPGDKIGSSDVRAALAAGDMAGAAALLGRPWIVDGVVAEGQRLGRQLGFPTANLTLGDVVAPRHGVYAVLVDVGDVGEGLPGVANYGRRPTVGGDEPLLEVHVLDGAFDLYGRAIAVRFERFLRPERKFDGLDALKAQIAADCDAARAVLTV